MAFPSQRRFSHEPTLIFMIGMLVLVRTGIVDDLHHGFIQPETPQFGRIPHGLTLLLVLKAFSSACSSLTGHETISNAVPIFRDSSKGSIKAYRILRLVTAITLLISTVRQGDLGEPQQYDAVTALRNVLWTRWKDWGHLAALLP